MISILIAILSLVKRDHPKSSMARLFVSILFVDGDNLLWVGIMFSTDDKSPLFIVLH